jgi:hypothetical protein
VFHWVNGECSIPARLGWINEQRLEKDSRNAARKVVKTSSVDMEIVLTFQEKYMHGLFE